MLPLDVELPLFFVAVFLCLVTGAVLSRPEIFKLFLSSSSGVYLKAGEYGETELENKWSVFKEPLNSWTSLAYSVFGIIVLFTGLIDLQNRDPNYLQAAAAAARSVFSSPTAEQASLASTSDAPATFNLVATGENIPLFRDPLPAADFSKNNLLANFPSFSIIYGLGGVYLGIASCLFHATHSEVWRKADAGMTSGVVVPLFGLALWDKLRPPALSEEMLVLFCLLVLVSFTHGYLPYGSSDILLPSLVAFGWTVEFAPRYGGATDPAEYVLWGQCAYVTLAGVLLRATDIKRKNVTTKRVLLVTYLALTYLFSWLLGYSDSAVILGTAAGLITMVMPEKGHVFWHIFSAYALYKWWILMRTRPDSQRGRPTHRDVFFFTVLLFVFVKNAWRRIFMNMPVQWFKTLKVRQKVFNLTEHVLFSVWGWVVIVVLPTAAHSWLFHTTLFWSESPFFNSTESAFHLFYVAKVGTHIEDLLYLAVVYYNEDVCMVGSSSRGARPVGLPIESIGASSSSDPDLNATVNGPIKKPRDFLMDIHHILAALLCIASYATGYVAIGSVVMLLHDISDIPLALLMIFNNLKTSTMAMVLSYVATLSLWLYWRLWILPSRVLYSIVFEVQRSKMYEYTCGINEMDPCSHICNDKQVCSPRVYFYELVERTVWIALIVGLLILHVLWFKQLLSLGLREFKKLRY